VIGNKWSRIASWRGMEMQISKTAKLKEKYKNELKTQHFKPWFCTILCRKYYNIEYAGANNYFIKQQMFTKKIPAFQKFSFAHSN
jgi:hypothetical protein